MPGLWNHQPVSGQQIVSLSLSGMSQIRGTSQTSAEDLEEDGYTNVLNEERREDCDDNGYCGNVSMIMIS